MIHILDFKCGSLLMIHILYLKCEWNSDPHFGFETRMTPNDPCFGFEIQMILEIHILYLKLDDFWCFAFYTWNADYLHWFLFYTWKHGWSLLIRILKWKCRWRSWWNVDDIFNEMQIIGLDPHLGIPCTNFLSTITAPSPFFFWNF